MKSKAIEFLNQIDRDRDDLNNAEQDMLNCIVDMNYDFENPIEDMSKEEIEAAKAFFSDCDTKLLEVLKKKFDMDDVEDFDNDADTRILATLYERGEDFYRKDDFEGFSFILPFRGQVIEHNGYQVERIGGIFQKNRYSIKKK